MYRIIGCDGKEYGPVSADQVNEWLTEGRIQADTRAHAEGSAKWRSIQEFPGFAETLKRRAQAATGGAPTATGKTSGLAIASLVLGVLGLVTAGISALGGLVTGIVALVRIRKSQGKLQGRGLAIAGTGMSALCIVLVGLVFAAASILPGYMQSQWRTQQGTQCTSNLKQLALGLITYANDNEHLPGAEAWCDATLAVIKSEAPFRCRQGEPGRRCHYAFNFRLAGLPLSKIQSPTNTVMVFETPGGWNASGGPEMLIPLSRHGRSLGLAFADGHVEMALRERLKTVRWEP